MVDNLHIKDRNIRFNLIFEYKDDPKNNIVVNAAKKALSDAFGDDVNVDIEVAEQETVLSKVKHIIRPAHYFTADAVRFYRAVLHVLLFRLAKTGLYQYPTAFRGDQY